MQLSRVAFQSFCALVAVCMIAAPSAAQLCPPDWAATPFATSGVSGEAVTCSAVYDNGFGPKLYVGGSFTTTGGAPSQGIAMWDGTSWQSVGGGVMGSVNSMVVHNDGSGSKLYVGGWFLSPGMNVATWDGFIWGVAGTGFDSGVQGMASYDDGSGLKLYAGGWFNAAGSGSPALNRLARWDGVSWTQVGAGLNSGLECAAVFNNVLYLAGGFTVAGGIPAVKIVKYSTGGVFTAIGNGVPTGAVNNFLVHDDGTGPALYICGTFTTIAGFSANRIVKYDGTNFTALGAGLSSTSPVSIVFGMASYNDGTGPGLYAMGTFTTAGAVAANRIAKWDGSAWSALGGGLNSVGRTGAVYGTPYGNSLFVGGTMTAVGTQNLPAFNMAVWGPTPPSIATPPASQTVNAGASVTFTVSATGQGLTYQWRQNSAPIPGATQSSLTIPAVNPIHWGPYDVVVSNGCGSTTSAAGTLMLNPAFNLSMTQPFGSLSLFITWSAPAQPGASYLTTFGFDPQNVLSPGGGPWGGLWITFPEIVAQFQYFFPPFVGTGPFALNGAGQAAFPLSAGQLPLFLFGQTVTAVSMTWSPQTATLINNSNLVQLTIQ